jgi:hypothetical protein
MGARHEVHLGELRGRLAPGRCTNRLYAYFPDADVAGALTQATATPMRPSARVISSHAPSNGGVTRLRARQLSSHVELVWLARDAGAAAEAGMAVRRPPDKAPSARNKANTPAIIMRFIIATVACMLIHQSSLVGRVTQMSSRRPSMGVPRFMFVG